MTTRDVRIGNFLDRNGLMEVRGINLKGIRIYDHVNKCSISYSFPAHSFNGIPLTREWCEKCGLIITDDRNKFYIHNQIYIELERNYVMIGTWIIFRCEYVHQLQNFYYLLLGKELPIKQ